MFYWFLFLEKIKKLMKIKEIKEIKTIAAFNLVGEVKGKTITYNKFHLSLSPLSSLTSLSAPIPPAAEE